MSYLCWIDLSINFKTVINCMKINQIEIIKWEMI